MSLREWGWVAVALALTALAFFLASQGFPPR